MKISGSIPAKNRIKGNTSPVFREGMVPSVIYGGKIEPKMVSVHNITLKKRFEEGQFYSKVFELDIDGTKEAVVVKSIQRHKVKNFPIHVDFQRVDDKTRITVSIPIEFTNQELCPGLKKGGLLNVVRRELELSCLANNIPEKFEIDLEGKEIGDVKEVAKPNHQSIDQSKLVPLLVASVQELIAENETLKTRITTLESA